MIERQPAGRALVAWAKPWLERGDWDGLAARLERAWPPGCLTRLLDGDDVGVVETAAVCLGLIGDSRSARPLARLLHHDRRRVVAAAENALWSIWFRAAGPGARAELSRIAAAIRAGDARRVLPMLSELIQKYPTFAEAFHQRSQAHYLRDAHARALRDARRACELNPLHFAALANQAHAHAAMGHYAEALDLYRGVLRIHPRFDGIRTAIVRLQRLAAPALA